MSLEYRFSYHFYPVGQGLFSTGAIRRHDHDTPSFLWVYDCGTSSSGVLVDRGISRLDLFVNDRKRIDLLILSHFDKDHINGVVRLLAKFKIGTLMLPYMPLAERLIIAFEEGSGGVNDPLTEFYLNPVDFLLGQDGPGIERILFVLPSGDDGPTYPGDLPRSTEPDNDLQISYDTAEPEDADDVRMLVQAGNDRSTEVDYLKPGSRLVLSKALWEFIPYNDDPKKEITVDFLGRVKVERSNLLSVSTDTTRKDALAALKKIYDNHFGGDSKNRNLISLFLYSGPIYSRFEFCRLIQGQSDIPGPLEIGDRELIAKKRTLLFNRWLKEHGQPRSSILYTGDGYLDTHVRLQKLIKYLDERRVQRIGVFQVMHHGSTTNWHQGIGSIIEPIFSIFSSDPEDRRYNHPHASVLHDFWRYGAVQVDKEANFTAYGYGTLIK